MTPHDSKKVPMTRKIAGELTRLNALAPVDATPHDSTRCAVCHDSGWKPSELGGSVPCSCGTRPNLGVLDATPSEPAEVMWQCRCGTRNDEIAATCVDCGDHYALQPTLSEAVGAVDAEAADKWAKALLSAKDGVIPRMPAREAEVVCRAYLALRVHRPDCLREGGL